LYQQKKQENAKFRSWSLRYTKSEPGRILGTFCSGRRQRQTALLGAHPTAHAGFAFADEVFCRRLLGTGTTYSMQYIMWTIF
jgi:hypothetical protein